MFPNLYGMATSAENVLQFSDLLTDEAKQKQIAGKAAKGALAGITGKEKAAPAESGIGTSILGTLLSSIKFGAPQTKPSSLAPLEQFMQYIMSQQIGR
jgi:hypothetical protein